MTINQRCKNNREEKSNTCWDGKTSQPAACKRIVANFTQWSREGNPLKIIISLEGRLCHAQKLAVWSFNDINEERSALPDQYKWCSLEGKGTSEHNGRKYVNWFDLMRWTGRQNVVLNCCRRHTENLEFVRKKSSAIIEIAYRTNEYYAGWNNHRSQIIVWKCILDYVHHRRRNKDVSQPGGLMIIISPNK